MVSDVSLEMQSDSKNYVGLQDDEITEPVHTQAAQAQNTRSYTIFFFTYMRTFSET